MAELCKICENNLSQKKEKSTGDAYNASLIIAADKAHKECLKFLIKAGADVNYQNFDDTMEHLCETSGSKQYSTAEESSATLISFYHSRNSLGDPGFTDYNEKKFYKKSYREEGKYTPLMLSSLNGDAECVEILLQKGADVNITSKYGLTALMCAAAGGHGNCIEQLIHAGADVNRGQDIVINLADRHMASFYALGSGIPKCFWALAEEGTDEEKCIMGFTALMYAAKTGNGT